MQGQTLRAVDHVPNLGMTLTKILSWKTHIVNKALFLTFRTIRELAGALIMLCPKGFFGSFLIQLSL